MRNAMLQPKNPLLFVIFYKYIKFFSQLIKKKSGQSGHCYLFWGFLLPFPGVLLTLRYLFLPTFIFQNWAFAHFFWAFAHFYQYFNIFNFTFFVQNPLFLGFCPLFQPQKWAYKSLKNEQIKKKRAGETPTQNFKMLII